MKKILFFIAIVSFSTIGFTACSEDDTVMETPTANPNPNVSNQLVLKTNAANNFVPLGQSVMLSTTSNGTAITDVVYYVDGVKIPGNTYKHSTIANVKIQSKLAGYLDSNVVTVQFAQKPF
ncbi:hypothetical protein P3875_01330 [Myroides sp. JBRI-B21084]|uniref:hypothetical protein n=1 Tax=Myroides sp. JBRI-B21084 TaxID=3119977 RepID=UPI0026E2239D|nr:hypothetical protein [Paenimyroides cloacae]WKW46741.1 hypothetical protein P3875_01330 [Paenimyroides cloacae]